MAKRKPNKVDAILAADWHLRDTVPSCRKDDYWDAQWRKVGQVMTLADKHKCSVFHAGDLLDKWKASPRLLNKCIRRLPNQLITIFGQHELPNHNYDEYYRSGLYTLYLGTGRGFDVLGPKGQEDLDWCQDAYHARIVIYGIGWNDETNVLSNIEKVKKSIKEGRKGGRFQKFVVMFHGLVGSGKDSWEHHADCYKAKGLLKELNADLIVSGDNHKPFTVKDKKGRLLVNPGSLMRMTTDQKDHRPRVYLWNAEANEVEPHYLDIEEDVFREVSMTMEIADEKIDQFIQHVKKLDISLSFENNLEKFFKKSKTRKQVRELIREAINE